MFTAGPVEFPIVSTRLTSGGHPITLHLISTGAMADKTRFRQTRFHNFLSVPDAILDTHFTEWLPVWTILIEHPEGIFLIDTGERVAVTEPGYFRSSGILASWFDRSQFRFSINRDQEIDHQLKKINVQTEAVTAVILSHLHFDHTDGLYHFPGTPTYVNKYEWEHPFGALPNLYPPQFHPNLIDLTEAIGTFTKAAWLTKNKDLALVQTAGHTRGHSSVILKTDDHHVLFAGDICYSQDQLLTNAFSANAASYNTARHTYEAIKTYARHHPLIFLPSHDPNSAVRLKLLQPLP